MSNQLGGNPCGLGPTLAIPSTSVFSLGSVGVQNAVNVTEVGELYSVSLAALDTPQGSLTCNLEIQIDGQTTQILNLYTAGTLNAALIAFSTFVDTLANFHVFLPFNSRYNISLRVGLNITVAGPATAINFGVTRGQRY